VGQRLQPSAIIPTRQRKAALASSVGTVQQSLSSVGLSL
jgi:hypothetical protein